MAGFTLNQSFPEGEPMKEARRTAVSEAPPLALISTAYFAVAFLGLQLASINASATPIWPATGLAIAAMLWRGYLVATAIFIAAFAVN
jgi:hypothetical protein